MPRRNDHRLRAVFLLLEAIISVSLPNGIIFSLGTTIDSEKSISAISNASPAVATCATNGYSDGDFVIIRSGWQKINDRIFRVASQQAGSFELEGLNSASTKLYPAGSGAGGARKVATFTQITQVLESTTQGGEMQFATYSFLENDYESQIPTQHSAQTLQLSIADDPSLAGYAALKNAAATRDAIPLKAQMPNGSVIMYYGYISFNETPTMTKNQVMACSATFSLMSLPVRYAT